MSRTAVLRQFAIAAVLASSTACYVWKTEPGPIPQAAISVAGKGSELRVRLLNGTDLYFVDARVVGDSLVGMGRGEPRKIGFGCTIWCAIAARSRPSYRQSVPLSDVKVIDRYEFIFGHVAHVVVVIVGVVALVGLIGAGFLVG